jgi:hypothetical protein
VGKRWAVKHFPVLQIYPSSVGCTEMEKLSLHTIALYTQLREEFKGIAVKNKLFIAIEGLFNRIIGKG